MYIAGGICVRVVYVRVGRLYLVVPPEGIHVRQHADGALDCPGRLRDRPHCLRTRQGVQHTSTHLPASSTPPTILNGRDRALCQLFHGRDTVINTPESTPIAPVIAQGVCAIAPIVCEHDAVFNTRSTPRSASERTGYNLKRFKHLYLNTEARIWP